MDFRLLGPVEAYVAQRPVPLGRRRERCLLGLLLLEAGNVLTMDRLVALLWNDDPPPAVHRSVHAHVARLRAGLSPYGVRIVTAGTGYLADVDPQTVDVHRFTGAVAKARALAGPAERAALLDEALALWRGPLLADVAGDDLRERVGAGLEELRRLAIELRAGALLDCGLHHQVAAGLPALIKEYPTREKLVELLMVALYRCGQQAEALAVYRRTRQVLVDELGVEPGPDLQRTQSLVLLRDPVLAAPTSSGAPPRWRFLPRDIPDFTGRAADLDQLDALAPDRDDVALAVVITTIAGTAGIGKTALAVHWAHRMAHRFPDGQLYLNLRGYDTGRSLRPIEALAQLLRALGLSGDKVPIDEQEAADLYRSVLADKRVLVVLDNARSVDQVRPLLPSSGGSVALITSRDRLTGLLARDGARRLTLDVLGRDEAVALLSRIVGADRVQAEPDAARDLADLCGHLPLALRIAAANLADRPERTIADQVAALREGNPVTSLAVEGDRQSALRAAFDQSYATLEPGAQELFRMLGLIPGEDFTRPAAAALAEVSPYETARLLDRLAAAHLVVARDEHRFTMHDLVRRYAHELADAVDGDRRCRLAFDRLCRWYLDTADAAARQLYPHMLRLPVTTGARVEFDRPGALAWLDTERANLVAATVHAAEHGDRPHAWLLADTLRGYFYLRRDMVGWLATAGAGLAAAMAAGDARAEAAAHHSLGVANASVSRYPEAADHYARAIDRSVRIGWPECQAAAVGNAAVIDLWTGRLPQAASGLNDALRIYRDLGSLAGQAINLANLGIVHLTTGDLARAADNYRQALALHEQVGARNSQALVRNNLGEVYRTMGRFDLALDHFTAALEVHREVGGLGGEALVLGNLAAIHRDTGRLAEALEHAEAALLVVRRTGDLHAEAYTLNRLATVHTALGRYRDAVDGHTEALNLTRQTGSREPEADAHIGLATAWLRLGRTAEAHRHAEQGLALSRRFGLRIFEGLAHTTHAEVHLERGDPAGAIRHATAAVDILGGIGHRFGEARALGILGRAVGGPEGDDHATRAAAILAALKEHGRAARTLETGAA
jgi:DNA-binding SARP family transcriptional activator/tetratricopeptide (TPR) repeat protein